jgi:D-glycero-alpha-D-manno-heptose-7-phosphate kinase
MANGKNQMDKTEKKPLRIIRSTAPIRVNDIGGWTDTWFSKQGKVLNMAVSPLVEVHIKSFENSGNKQDRVLVQAKNYEEIFRVNPDKPDYQSHPLIQGALDILPVPKELELEICLFSSAPAGCSTGTSAAVVVALLGALDSLTPGRLSPHDLAVLAHRVETEKLCRQSGIQDQICAARGGICFINMHKYPQARISNLELDDEMWHELDRRTFLIYLGQTHSSSALHEKVISHLEKKGLQFKTFQKLRSLARQAKDNLLQGDLNSFGEMMIQNNECQRSLHEELISEEADTVFSVAKKYKACGWKVNGAGGKGGSLTILSHRDRNLAFRMLEQIDALGRGIRSIPISLAKSGLEVREEPV